MIRRKFFKEIRKIAIEYGYDIEEVDESKIVFGLDRLTGIRIFLELDKNNNFQLYFLIKTSSWDYNGERTDIHDVISSLFAAYLRVSDEAMSCTLFDIPHPLGIDDIEIYGRYIVPTQFNKSFQKLDNNSYKRITRLLVNIISWKHFFWSAVGCPCSSCRKENNHPYEYSIDIPFDFKDNIVRELFETDNSNEMSRYLPTWDYYKDFDKLISIIQSNHLATLYKVLIELNENTKIFKGVNGNLYHSKYIYNYISESTINRAEKLFYSLEKEVVEIFYIPIDNMVISIGVNFVLFIEQSGNLYEYKKEKNIIQDRNKKENEILFPINSLKWADRINPEDFESLVKDLLELEPNSLRVRKVAPLNQPDKGRDLILEWQEANINNMRKDNESPYSVKKIIVQCKAFKKSVGKSDVNDIRDTIDSFNYDGYFLVVSSQITTTLTDYLDQLRNRGIWIDWWNKDELEERLNRNRELLLKYSDIVWEE